MELDIRWVQRFDSYTKACKRVLEITESDRGMFDLSELEKEGLIQRFEYTFELAWKVLQDYLQFLGFQFQTGPNSTLQTAFENGLISNHDGWRRMAKARIHIMKGMRMRLLVIFIMSMLVCSVNCWICWAKRNWH